MGLDDFLRVGNHQLSVVVQKSIEHLEYFRRCKIELVKYDPVAISHCSYKRPLLEHEVAHCVADVRSEIFLNVRVCVVVDSDKFVPGAECKILHERRFSCVKTLAKRREKTVRRADNTPALVGPCNRTGKRSTLIARTIFFKLVIIEPVRINLVSSSGGCGPNLIQNPSTKQASDAAR
jgi:hypothetical protein